VLAPADMAILTPLMNTKKMFLVVQKK
jgi:hypothetical protein